MIRGHSSRFIAAALLLTVAAATAWAASGDTSGRDAAAPEIRAPHQYVYIVYFNPADRECLPDYRERLDRVMTEIQTWYRAEMVRNGFEPMTFPLERDEDGTLVVHVVKSSRSYAYEEKISGRDVRDEQVKPAMLAKGIDIDQEHVIIFQNTLFVTDKDGAKVIKNWAPYGGGGRRTDGTASVIDFEQFDPLNLPEKAPRILDGGRRAYTLGHYVVIHMGGVAHELGHALGLPHNTDTPEQRKTQGFALMGSGNYHLFGERAGDEQGAYLSAPHSAILSSHPLFTRNLDVLEVEADCRFREIEFTPGDGEYIVRGRVEATPRAYAVVGYHDRMRHDMDYDAMSWVGEVDDDGRFEVRVGALEPGWFELRLRCYMLNGQREEIIYRFTLDKTLTIPVDELARQTLYEIQVKPAVAAEDADALLEAIGTLDGVDDVYLDRARACHRIMTRTPAEPVELSALGDEVHEVWLSSAKWASATVGWRDPVRDYLPDERRKLPLESGEAVHGTGLYAHSKATYVYDLDGTWKTFTSGCGLQNLREGSVVFVVKCDGEERFRSKPMRDWTEGRVEVDVSGVKQLELIVEDAGDGGWGDWGVWFSPKLAR